MSFDIYICVIISAHVLCLFNLYVFGKVTPYYMFFCSFLPTPILHCLVVSCLPLVFFCVLLTALLHWVYLTYLIYDDTTIPFSLFLAN